MFSSIVHLTNAVNVKRGGAQRVLELIRRSTESYQLAFCVSDRGAQEAVLGGRVWPLRLLWLLLTLRPAILVVHSRFYLPFVWILDKASPLKVVFVCHSRFDKFPWVFRFLRLRHYIAVSNTVKDYLARYVPEERIEVILNGVNELEMILAPERTKGYFGFVGRLDANKGLAIAINALSVVADRLRRDLFLDVIGSGPDMEMLQSMSRSILVHVTFHGFKERPFDLLRQADAVLIPSFVEGFCLVLPEGMIHGKEIFASELPVLREVSAGADTVHFFAVGSVDSLADKIESYLLANSRNEVDRCVSAQVALELYGVSAMQASYRSYFSRLLGGIQ